MTESEGSEQPEPVPYQELHRYQEHLRKNAHDGGTDSQRENLLHEVRNAPLISYSVKAIHDAPTATGDGSDESPAESDVDSDGLPTNKALVFPEYALLGQCLLSTKISHNATPSTTDSTPSPITASTNSHHESETASSGGLPLTSANQSTRCDPVLLNVNSPWSAFLCGLQGSGKSYTLSCMLEGCLLSDERINSLRAPLAGLVFHYDTNLTPSEAACLCSIGIKVKVLVPETSLQERRTKYESFVRNNDSLSVEPFYLQDSHLDVARIKRLMAFSDKDGVMPLYMETVINLLRSMALESGSHRIRFDEFKRRVEGGGPATGGKWLDMQSGPLRQRMSLLENIVKSGNSSASGKKKRPRNLLTAERGTLTIVDLSDPFFDPPSACALFEIVLAMFLEMDDSVGKVVALDEAHNYMGESTAAENFTGALLKAIREQRHKNVRVIISTQEPTISPRLLDLCSLTLIHNFQSPAWLSTVQSHLVGVFQATNNSAQGFKQLLQEITQLRQGEGLLFCPKARLEVDEARTGSKRLDTEYRKFKTRLRLSEDGGASLMNEQ